MTVKPKRTSIMVWVLLLLVGFLSLGGFYGGILLLKDPSGELIGFPTEMIEKLPFQDYLLPGLFLLGIYGCLGMTVVYGLVRGMAKARVGAGMLGVILMIWITVQVWFLGPPVVALQIIYFGLGMSIAGISQLPSVKQTMIARKQN